MTRTTTRWRLERTDATTVRVLLVVLVTLYPVLVIAPPLVRWATGRTLVWSSSTNLGDASVPELSGPGVAVSRTDEVVWTLRHASAGQWLASLVPALLTWALLLMGCVVAWRLVRAALSGDPFAAATTRGLRVLGVVVIAYGALVPTVTFLASMAVLWPVDTAGALAWLVDLSAFFVPLVIGMMIVVVAECFRIGQRLSDDVAGLV